MQSLFTRIRLEIASKRIRIIDLSSIY
ncbi:hypothetical protein DCM90_05070 [Levilactobacillus bambusae]|uniref:Uncharacterized protein n=1 Tax=Levilactobacillus bambusae TaxID=2024736 RepID=A0A2V1MZ62_9LACO|nr:hypothetical protein DCM90_05070 [Levilactobacillus bambusae]